MHAIAVQDGAVVAEAGNGGRVSYLRSAAKPFQALPLVRSRDDLDDEDIAIMCASHQAEPAQIAAVRALLAKADAFGSELECGVDDGRPPEPLYHNCSGKHAGMLALCRLHGWPRAEYRLAEHPLQQAMLAEVAAAAEIAEGEIPTAVDGCGVVTFALSLERMAFMYSRLERLHGGPRVAAAMQAHPELVGGAGAIDTTVMRALPSWTAKRGAEALLCVAGPAGLGIALKVEDGNPRALQPALAVFLAELGTPLDLFARAPLTNSRGETVGELTVV